MSIYEKTKCARALLYWAANNNGNEAYYLEDRMYAVADNGMVIILTADSYDEAIRKAKARPQGEWIPVSERLPDDGEEVLTCRNGGFREIQSFEHGDYWENQNGDCTDFDDDDVIAWQPLPEPY